MKDSLKKFTFKSRRAATVDGLFVIPVPDGFNYSTDKKVIGNTRFLSIVPKDYGFDKDPMEADWGLTITTETLSVGMTFDPDYIPAYTITAERNFRVFREGVMWSKIRPRVGFGILYQMFDAPDFIKLLAMVFAEEKLYSLHLIKRRYVDTEPISDEEIDAFQEMVDEWLERIRLVTEPEYVSFPKTKPPFYLYSHYNGIRSLSQNSFPGVKAVVNEGGTEHAFIPIKEFPDMEELSEKDASIYNRIAESDMSEYNLYDKAKTIQALFHVNDSKFDPRHDRESEIQEGLLHRAYMLSALRSFAWTLCAYCCEEENLEISDIKYDKIKSIIDFIAGRDWLNYDDELCEGLCASDDLHVFYIPDSVSESDKEYLELSNEEALFNSDASVCSLDSLRKDLEYIYPAIHILYSELKKKRDYNEPLVGNEADILYAWCSLAIAAKEPFFNEDGPMTNSFSKDARKSFYN